MENAAFAAAKRPLDYLAEIVREGVVPGAALVASRRGSVKLKKAVGTCCRVDRRQARLTLDTMHPLYSFSKLITGTVVAISVTEGRLDYSDLVSKHIPEFTGGGKEAITIRHCLTHSAGLAKVQSKPVRDAAGLESGAGEPLRGRGGMGAGITHCLPRLERSVPRGRVCPPRQRWRALGGACHKILFAPLGAKSLSYALPPNSAHVAIVPQPSADKPLPATAEAAFGYAGQPGAGCFGTLGDALKVLHFHLQEGVWKSKRMISPEVFREMHTVQYAREIAAAQAAGETPKHEPWGLGPLLRGTGPACEAHNWFGFHHQTSPGIFGHAGINTFIGVGDPKLRVALVFTCTNSPKSAEQTCLVRNKVTDLVFAAWVNVARLPS